jgi:predicted small secreted protein
MGLKDSLMGPGWALIEVRHGFQPIRNHAQTRTTITHKNLSIALMLRALLAASPLLGACQTTAGAGEDISAGGHALTNSAEKHAP